MIDKIILKYYEYEKRITHIQIACDPVNEKALLSYEHSCGMNVKFACRARCRQEAQSLHPGGLYREKSAGEEAGVDA